MRSESRRNSQVVWIISEPAMERRLSRLGFRFGEPVTCIFKSRTAGLSHIVFINGSLGSASGPPVKFWYGKTLKTRKDLHMKDLTKGTPTRIMISFAVPVALGNMFQLCYSLADTRVVGSALGETALAAVGATAYPSALFLSAFCPALQTAFLC